VKAKRPLLGRFAFLHLVRNVREKPHETRALYCHSESSLILGGKAGLPAIENTRMRVQELRKDFRILVVDVLDVVLVEIILLVHGNSFNS
jgi:hypothetical protein